MMCGGDLHKRSKLLGHSNIKMTEHCAKLARKHIVKRGSVSREVWSKLELTEGAQEKVQKKNGNTAQPRCVRIVSGA